VTSTAWQDAGSEQDVAARMYLDLLKGVLTRRIPGDEALVEVPFRPAARPLRRRLAHKYVQRYLESTGCTLARSESADAATGARGGKWPRMAESMIGMPRLDNVQSCGTTVITERVPGDLIETGVWRGGATILMRAVLAAFGDTERTVWVADSFEGLPPPNPADYPADLGDKHHTKTELAVSLEQVQANFRRYGLLDDQVRFLKGWFKETLPDAPIDRVAVMRLDGDMYESTIQAFEALYPRLSVGGFVIVDDYGEIEQARQATEDFRSANGITEVIQEIDGSGVFWRRAA
jgi:O-methyltransferase